MRDSPEAVFAEAGAAMRRGDWHAVFTCIDRDSLGAIVTNGVARLLMGGPEARQALVAAFANQGVSADGIDRVSEAGARVVASGQRPRNPDPAAMVPEALRHKALVDEYNAAIKALASSAKDVPRLAADLEIALRQLSGGGSVSSRLFVDETLEAVTIDGDKARAVRRTDTGATEDVKFVRRRGGWLIRPFVR